ncbi:MAG TPA: VOC family protein [Candidatus Saccharimonadales bacterium]|nr:VOC family protein [Candidatus Saccharimonadales bacterium]
MFKDSPTFASFSVDDMQQAKDFYGTTLGIPTEEHMPGIMTLKTTGAGDVNIFLKNHHTPATYTILNFVVDDIAATMQELSEKGITYEHYDGDEDIYTNEQGIAEFAGVQVCWFKDPAGNLLQLLQMPA